jgi:hypothetical protein
MAGRGEAIRGGDSLSFRVTGTEAVATDIASFARVGEAAGASTSDGVNDETSPVPIG